ncbi:MAG: apolipoprotein N-acyltransferase [Bacteroidetes bacterium GWF2_38_335]|nr:MAG: apolipoprotein N-acyltransferase [Bacteroidetes bacterium GWF2_38_335]OFY79507.1 MAG: apolipoprotein N-acyltransferase [Bacteroidetes bacterium RIFOXYA12_FULL_38_20]HBS86554.1 apolipoprotein N-acyltransferase [Bacteroidales bacterium]
MKLTRKHFFLFSVITGLLLSVAWRTWGTGFVLMIAFLPLLMMEEYFDRNKAKNRSVIFMLYSLISFFIWNAISTWWIWYASPFGASAAIILNAIFMSFIFWLFHVTKRRLGERFGYFAFVFYWLAFEYMHFHWELSWSWLTLGNGFGHDILFVQWYEFTGHQGGSLWVLVVNVLLFLVLKKYMFGADARSQKANRIGVACVIFIPVFVSLIQYFTYKEKEDPYEIVVIQPNIDPYNEKFGGMTQEQQLSIILELADSLAGNTTDYVIGPETAISGMWEEDMNSNIEIQRIRKFAAMFPDLKFVLGLTSFRLQKPGEPEEEGMRTDKRSGMKYYAYNAAMQIDKREEIQIYHKSKLVLGVEKMPFAKLLASLGDIAIDLGGTTGTLGLQDDREVFFTEDKKNGIAPVICYESIFGEYVGEYVQNGANMIFIITNDGWWKDTPGYRQHLSYASLRAIETRRSIARSANTGISCFVNQRGEIIDPTNWWVRTAIKGTINANDYMTFYVRMGDYIGRGAAFFTVLLLLYTLVYAVMGKRR